LAALVEAIHEQWDEQDDEARALLVSSSLLLRRRSVSIAAERRAGTGASGCIRGCWHREKGHRNVRSLRIDMIPDICSSAGRRRCHRA
jgi:hypothetical protein